MVVIIWSKVWNGENWFDMTPMWTSSSESMTSISKTLHFLFRQVQISNKRISVFVFINFNIVSVSIT